MARGILGGLAGPIALLVMLGCGDRSPGDAASGLGDAAGGPGDAAGKPGDDRLLVAPRLLSCDPEAPLAERVRVASWNIHAGRTSSLDTVANVLAATDADVIALQEVDVGVQRTGEIDQPAVLANRLGYEYVFAQSIEYQGGAYGLAVLSRLPLAAVERISLDAAAASERRIGLDVTVCAGPSPLRIVSTHLDYIVEANVQNTRDLLAAVDGAGGALLLAGDFNVEPEAPSIQDVLAAGFYDVLAARDPAPTYGGRRIDYFFADARLSRAVISGEVMETADSDHRLLLIDVSGAF